MPWAVFSNRGLCCVGILDSAKGTSDISLPTTFLLSNRLLRLLTEITPMGWACVPTAPYHISGRLTWLPSPDHVPIRLFLSKVSMGPGILCVWMW